MELPEQFPFKKPKIHCKTSIYHPNIDMSSGGDVCFTLNEDWTCNYGLQDVVQALLFLLYNPQLDDALADYVTTDQEQFEKHVNEANRGDFNPDEEMDFIPFNHNQHAAGDLDDYTPEERKMEQTDCNGIVAMKTIMRRVDSVLTKSTDRWIELQMWGVEQATFGAHPIAF